MASPSPRRVLRRSGRSAGRSRSARTTRSLRPCSGLAGRTARAGSRAALIRPPGSGSRGRAHLRSRAPKAPPVRGPRRGRSGGPISTMPGSPSSRRIASSSSRRDAVGQRSRRPCRRSRNAPATDHSRPLPGHDPVRRPDGQRDRGGPGASSGRRHVNSASIAPEQRAHRSPVCLMIASAPTTVPTRRSARDSSVSARPAEAHKQRAAGQDLERIELNWAPRQRDGAGHGLLETSECEFERQWSPPDLGTL